MTHGHNEVRAYDNEGKIIHTYLGGILHYSFIGAKRQFWLTLSGEDNDDGRDL